MWKSTVDRYGRIAISIHWISALLIIGMMIAGFRAAAMTDIEAKASLLRIHASLGVALLILTLARIGWWLLADRRPALCSNGCHAFVERALDAARHRIDQ